MHSEKFTFKYQGDLEYISIDTLFVSQLHFSELIKAIKGHMHPQGEIKIKVRTLPPGSFPIEILIELAEGGVNLLTYGAGAVISAGAMAKAITSVMELYSKLKGKKPIKEEVSGDTTIIYIDNSTHFTSDTFIYEMVKNNSRIRQELAGTFEPIINDDSVTGVNLEDEYGAPIITVPRDDFDSYSYGSINSIAETTQQIRTIKEEGVNLSVFKLVFSAGFQWQFYYKGNRISASIADEDFNTKVGTGAIQFAAGDILQCDLEITQKFSDLPNTFINHSYKVIKVISHVPRGKDGSLF